MRRYLAAACACVMLLTFGCGSSDRESKPKSAVDPNDALTDAELATCFWAGPISMQRKSTQGFDGSKYNYPESSAAYWASRFTLQPGQQLVLTGEFPHARYMSFNTYREGAPVSTISDIDIVPVGKSINPFIAGNRRDGTAHGFRLVGSTGPQTPLTPKGTLPIGETGTEIQLVYRVYMPDSGNDLRGGVALPSATIENADGTELDEAETCEAIVSKDRSIPILSIPADLWRSVVAGSPDPATAPALDPPKWERFFNQDFASTVFLEGTPRAEERVTMNPQDSGGFYSNADARYLVTHLSEEFGEVLVVTGKMPVFADTREGPETMPEAELRFWSLCSGESRATMRTPACLADDQVPLDSDRSFTIVVSKRSARPENAKPECGVAWLDWGDRGDGVDRDAYGLLILRNMKPANDFEHAVQRISKFGEESAVMGDYFPQSEYTSVGEFEKRGCNAVEQ